MKKAILLSVLVLSTMIVFSQNIYYYPEKEDRVQDKMDVDNSATFQAFIGDNIILRNDTLFVPAESCKYIKIGDKVYKVKVALEEVKEPQDIFLASPSFKAYPSDYQSDYPMDDLLLRLNPNMNYGGHYDKYTIPAINYLQFDSSHVITIPLNSTNQ